MAAAPPPDTDPSHAGPLYFDHINGAPLAPDVAAAMAPWLATVANPQMAYGSGRRAHMALEAARAQVADWLGAPSESVLFGASGTELNNLAIKGFLKANRRRGGRILVSAVEHPSVERACRRMVEAGYRLDTIPVDHTGRVDPNTLSGLLCDDTALVCVQLANPEVGTVMPIAELAALCKPHKAALMVDAVAASGRLPIDVNTLGADLLSVSSSNLGGPVGAAALYLRRGLRIQPEIDGGVQENGRRGGLENVAACVGFGASAQAAMGNMAHRIAHLSALAERLRGHLAPLPGFHLTGAEPVTGAGPVNRLPGHVSFLVDGAEGESLLTLLDKAGIAASSGSFCGAKAMKASPVLLSMGYRPQEALSGVVFSFGMDNSPEQVDQGAELLRQCVDQSKRALSGGT